MPIHRLLQRQLRRCNLTENEVPASLTQWQEFLERVSQAYLETDQERYTLEHSQEVFSAEMQELYDRLAESQRLAHLGTWIYDVNTGRRLWSPETYKIFGMDPAGEQPSLDELLKAFVEEDAALLKAARIKAQEEGIGYSLELRIKANNEIRWIYALCQPIFDKTSNKVYQLSGTVMDITQRKQSEEKVKALNQQLISTARQAGMAEVATSVLHNVGNVLNSVNVSANLLNEYIEQSKMQSLKQLADLLNKNKHDMENFLVTSPKAKHLPDYLIKLAEYWQQEKNALLKELALLNNNLSHIKEIIAMQQSVSGAVGIIDTIDVNEIFDTAYKINENFLEKAQVQVEKDYKADQLVSLDKVKLQQILINLLRNAKDAVIENKTSIKKIILRTQIDKAANKLLIQVVDNGIGVKPENLTRIFSYGFTTKKDGHGFGLHTSALSAQEMGGSLTAQSEGVGKGTTFTLELPLH